MDGLVWGEWLCNVEYVVVFGIRDGVPSELPSSLMSRKSILEAYESAV